MIAYATAPGDVAADGSGDNSPYTKALAKAMLARGLTVERVFKEVRNGAVVATKNNQVPWEASSLTGADFYFSGDGGPKPLSGAKAPAASAFDREVVYWQSIANSGEPGDYEAYLKQFLSGTFAELARARITSLEEQSGASQPSMEYPFDGVWDGWLRTYGGWFSAPVEASFRVVIKNGHLRGTVQMYDETRSINAMVNKSGSLSRGRVQGALQGYDLHGTVAKGLGDGAAMGWKLEYRMTRAE